MAKPTTKSASKKKGKPSPKAKPARPAARASASSNTKKGTKAASKPAGPKRAVVAKQAPAKKAPAKVTTVKSVAKKGTGIQAGRGKTGAETTKIVVAKSPRPAISAKANGKVARLAPVSAIIPPPPPPRTKPGKNQAGLSMRELETFRDLLLAKRRELVGDMRSMEMEALQRSGENLSNLPMHMADMGTDNYEQEFTLGLMEKDRQLLREINQALSKIMDGRYGICEGTGKVISKARLEVQPWAKYSIEHARKLENRGVR